MATSCSTRNTVVPSACTRWSASTRTSSMMGASPSDSSSRMRMRGRAMSPRPIAHICCSPPDMLPARWRWRSLRMGNSSYSAAMSRSMPRWSRRRYAPISRFSRTVICGKSRRPSGTWVIPPATMASELQPVISVPSSRTRPAVGGTMPQMALRSVDLPAPWLPTSVTMSPASTRRLTWRRIWTSPYPALSCSTSSTGPLRIAASEVGGHHVGIVEHLHGRALRQLLAVEEHDDAIRQIADGLHHVFDHDQGDSLAADPFDEADGGVDLGGVEPGHDLVQEEHGGPHGERASQLHALALGHVETVCRRLRPVGERDEVEHFFGAAASLGKGAGAAAGAEQGAYHHVLDDSEVAERLDDLEGPAHAETPDGMRGETADRAAAEADLARRARQGPRDEVDQGGLARAVGTDEAEDLAVLEVEAHLRHRGQSAEPLGHAPRLDEGHRSTPGTRADSGRACATRTRARGSPRPVPWA